MKILYPAAYFQPENIAFSHLEHDLFQALTEAGHEIDVLCPTPTRGISDAVWAEYRHKREETLYGGHVHVRRFWAPREGKNPLIRAFRYFWCNFRQYQLGKKYRQAELIFAGSTPPTQGLLAGCLKKKLNCPFVYNLQDIFPDSLVNTGLAKRGSLLWKIGRKVEDATYCKADQIVVISEDFRKNILEKGVPREKIELIYNWIDTDAVAPVPKEQIHLYEEFGIDRDCFLVVYAGNLGEAQNGRLILEAASLLREHHEIFFAVFGGGSEYASLQAVAADMGLENICFHPLLPAERVSEVYSAGDVALITCKPGTGTAGMPSKTWSIMAAGTPILASFDLDSELAHVIETARCGSVVDPAQPQALADALLAASRESKADMAEQGQCGRAYVMRYRGKNTATAAYRQVMEALVPGSHRNQVR